MLPIVLVHGGLYEEMTAEKFWGDSGVMPVAAAAGLDVLAPNRPAKPLSWTEEADALAESIWREGMEQVVLVAGSNGCSAALRVALDHPQLVARLMLCWPATAGDQIVDGLLKVIIEDESGPVVAGQLLKGDSLRGCTDAELRSINIPCVLYPAIPESTVHQRRTVTSLMSAIPDAMVMPGGPEPAAAEFPDFLAGFIHLLVEMATVDAEDAEN